MRPVFLFLLFSLCPLLRADSVPIDIVSNWPTTCLPQIPNVGPLADSFIAIVQVPREYVLANTSCPVLNSDAPPLALYDVVSHQPGDPQDDSLVMAFEFDDGSPGVMAYVSGPTDPPSVPEPALWPISAAIVLALFYGYKRPAMARNSRCER